MAMKQPEPVGDSLPLDIHVAWQPYLDFGCYLHRRFTVLFLFFVCLFVCVCVRVLWTLHNPLHKHTHTHIYTYRDTFQQLVVSLSFFPA